jgi:pantoate kinase
MLEVITSQAFAPSHITGFFKIYPNGSTGAGVNTSHGARTLVQHEQHHLEPAYSISINGRIIPAPVSEKILDKYDRYFASGILSIHHKLEYPVGYGMGMSGAGAFSLSLALNDVFKVGLSFEDCMQIAVESEIESGTGLGDVIAQKYHGVMMGLPPYPSRDVEVIPSEKKVVACGFFEPLETAKIIRDAKWKDRINEVGEECMRELTKEKSAEKFIELSRHFTFETGLAGKLVKQALKDIPQTSMAMLGQSIFLLAETEAEAKELLSHHCDHIHLSTIAEHGAKLL